MSQGQHPFEGPPILYVPGAPPIEPRGCIDGLFRGHLSQWATRNILSQGCLSHGYMPGASLRSRLSSLGDAHMACSPPIPTGNPEHPITGLPIPCRRACPESNPGAAFLHMHCSHLSGSRYGTLGGWWHPISTWGYSLTSIPPLVQVE